MNSKNKPYPDVTTMFKFSLVLAVAGLALFVATVVLKMNGLVYLADAFSKIGALVILSALMIIFFSGLGSLFRAIIRRFRSFFSKTSRSQRKLFYYLNKWQEKQSVFQHEKAKLLYNTQQKRKRLFKRINGA